MAGFQFEGFRKEVDALNAGAFRQVDILAVKCDAAGTVRVPAQCNALVLLPRVLDPDNVLRTSSVTARCFVRPNSPEAPGLPFSLITDSKDLTAFVGTIKELFITIETAAAGQVLYFAALLGAGVASSVGGTSTGGGYSPPPAGG